MTTAAPELPAELGDALATLDALTASLRVADTPEGVHDLAAAFAGALEPVRRAHAYLTNGGPPQGQRDDRGDYTDPKREARLLAAPKAGSQREVVLRALYRARIDGEGLEGLTDVQLADRTKLAANTVRPRRHELVEGGYVADSGERQSHGGRSHTVWRITDQGLSVYGQPQSRP